MTKIKKKLKVVDLFAGTGGFSLGLHQTGSFKTIFANDFDQNSKEIFDLNFDIDLEHKNIHNLKSSNIPDCDIITAGFPCQPFSIAGKREGFDDERSNVFWKLLEIIENKLPEIILLENVKNLVTHDNGNTFKIIKKSIRKLGYLVKYQILNTADVTDIPHNRERIYIIGFLNEDMYNHFEFPKKNKKINKITDYLQENPAVKYFYTNKSTIYDTLKKEIKTDIRHNVVYQYRRYYVRENKSNMCPTLTANMGTGGHNVPLILQNKKIRKLTPRECFNLQGFPKNYKFPKEMSDSKLYKLAGNAVSVPIIKLIGNNILSVYCTYH